VITVKLTPRTRILIGLAAGIAAYAVFAQKDPQTVESVKDTVRRPHVAAAPEPRTMHALFLLAHRVTDGAAAGALFAAHSWFVAPPPAPAPPAPTIEAPLRQAPAAPPLPFTYMGSYEPQGAAPVFFLTRGDRVYDVRVGDTLDDTYSVDALNNEQLVMTYKPLNIQQQLSVRGGP
jgi:hypothetical protein